LNNKAAIFLLLAANAVSGFAQGISMIAIPWYFINFLGGASLYNTIFITVTFVTLFWSPYAGTLIDRFPRKNIFFALCAVGLLLVGGIGFYGMYHHHLAVPWIIAVFAFTVLTYNLHYPALYALCQELTNRTNYGKVNSMLEIQGQATSMLSGAVAAILLSGFHWEGIFSFNIQPWQLYEIFLLDASTYLLALILISFIRYKPVGQEEVDKGTLMNRFKTGIRFLRNNPLLFYFGNLTYTVFVVVIVHTFYLLHIYVSDYLQEEGAVLALSEVFFAFGALSAGIGIRKIFRNVDKVKTILILMTVVVILMLLLSLTKSVVILLFISVLIGFSNSGTRIMRVTFLFENIPNKKIGRAGSIFQSFNILMRIILLGVFSIPFFITGIQHAYLVLAIMVGLAMIPLVYHYKSLNTLQVVDEA
jgi:MFS transporter, DHA3 family, macrolide efflux protein